MTNLDRIRQMDVDKMSAFLDRIREDDIDYGEAFCSKCEQTKENGMSCEKCLKWWLQLDVKDDEYFCVDFQMR